MHTGHQLEQGQVLDREQIDSFWEHGYLRIPKVFCDAQLSAMCSEMDWLIQNWASDSDSWTGPWRQVYMDEQTERQSKLVAMHDLHYYSATWMRAVTHPKLVTAMSDLLGPAVELHHSTMHVKPPSTGHPFPMHQDNPFYAHEDNRYVDVLVHLDDTCHENGEIRFVDGSHKSGALPHVLANPDGTECSPHLPTDQYKLADTMPVPAKRGDVVCFNLYTIHGSYINTTDRPRRLVRIGYRHPENLQTAGQSVNRPCFMVHGQRERKPGAAMFDTQVG